MDLIALKICRLDQEMSDSSDLSEERDDMSDTADQSEEIPDQSNLAAVVYRKFADLEKRCRAKPPPQPMSSEGTVSTDQVVALNLKKDQLGKLHSTLLPLLRQHIVTLAFELELSVVWEDFDEKFKTLSEVQSEFEHILDQINFAKHTICPVGPESDTITSDQHLKEFKIYRISFLQEKLNSLFCDNLRVTFHYCRCLLEELPTAECDMDRIDVKIIKGVIARTTTYSCDLIDSIIGWSRRSEFNLIQDEWAAWITSINQILNDFISLAGSDSIDSGQSLRRKQLKLARLAIPVIKLSRIFFKKLSKQVFNIISLPLLTEMSSHQIGTLQNLPCYIDSHMKNFFLELKRSTDSRRAISARSLLKLVQEHSKNFHVSLGLISSHLTPVIPDTDDFLFKNYFKNWLDTWNTEHLVATQNLIQAVKLIGRIE